MFDLGFDYAECSFCGDETLDICPNCDSCEDCCECSIFGDIEDLEE